MGSTALTTVGGSCLWNTSKLIRIKRFEMPNVKLTYFNLRGRGEPCGILLAYGGINYEDERIPPPWDPATNWTTLKPTTAFGILPILNWDGEEICQSWPVPGSWLKRLVWPAKLTWSRPRWT